MAVAFVWQRLAFLKLQCEAVFCANGRIAVSNSGTLRTELFRALWSLCVQPSGYYIYSPVVTICKPSGQCMYSPVVTIRTAQWSLCVQPIGHYVYSPVVTICTAQWSLHVQPSGHYVYSPVVTMRTTQRSLGVQSSGHHIYHQFNIQQFYVLPTECIYVFCVDLRTNSHYFPIQH